MDLKIEDFVVNFYYIQKSIFEINIMNSSRIRWLRFHGYFMVWASSNWVCSLYVVLVDLEPRSSRATPRTIYCVMQTPELLERLPALQTSRGRRSWCSRYLGTPELCMKGNFARMVKACSAVAGSEMWSFLPETWVLPDELVSGVD